ncbi:MAG: universal stress protein [Anaerolineales bacterium]|nr:universal stress protein [Anaerolineales bacterium]
MPFEKLEYQNALEDFRRARQQAALQSVVARLTGRSNQLLSYEDVAKKLRLGGRADRGVQTIPVAAIVGSVGRYTDFTRTFLPRQNTDQQRWANVKAATTGVLSPGMPPIDVYKVGQVYFVLDGNHRVSIARQEGMRMIEAHVIEVQTSIPLTPDIQPDDLIIKAEYAQFLEQTDLASVLPKIDLSLTAPGQYARLKEHIEVHRYFMGLEQQRDITNPEAILSWYDRVYLPVVTAIRERGLLRWFPERTETDLYLWVSEHRQALQEQMGWEVRPEAAAADLAVKKDSRAGDDESETGRWRTVKMLDRYTEHLFMDILVPISGLPASWQAADQAIGVARRERARLHGLYVLPGNAQQTDPQAEAIKSQFLQKCSQGGVEASFLVESGSISRRICARALLTDLVVLSAEHPPEVGLAGLGSGLRNIIRKCSRPLLAIPGEASPLDRALLAFDGSPKSKEALFVATYLAEVWQTALTVVAVSERRRVQPSTLDYPRAYLDLHELQAEFIHVEGPVDEVLHTMMHEHNLNLLLMGGYSISTLEEVLVGSAVNQMLRQQHWPIFFCK